MNVNITHLPPISQNDFEALALISLLNIYIGKLKVEYYQDKTLFANDKIKRDLSPKITH